MIVKMKRIASFSVDHTKLKPGLYLSRVDGDVTTYDLRTRQPNSPDLMDNVTMHSVEHMLATFLRNSDLADRIIYFGPMGCQTGFYLLVRNAEHAAVHRALLWALDQTGDYSGEVFGASEAECGNYRSLALAAAKRECAAYRRVLEGWGPEKLAY